MNDLRILAIDFDDTITERRHGMTMLRPGAKETINRLFDAGWEIVIWTCRNNPEVVGGQGGQVEYALKQVHKHLNDWGIKYTRVDEGMRGKILATHYIDDRAIEFKDNWAEIGERLKC